MRRFLLVYLLLLAASWAARWGAGGVDVAEQAAARAAEAVAAGAQALEVRGGELVYTLRQGSADGHTLLLLHGSPGSRGDFSALIEALPASWTILAPDLPGFGDSTFPVDDYSIAAHASDVLALLEAEAVSEVHVAGFSMGSGVMLELLGLAAPQVASISFIAGIGAQEMELFGSYELNHAVHGGQLAAISFLEWGVPHFGLLDSGMLNRAYARNFYDTDQRPLRARMEQAQLPVLIVHGKNDFLVPAAAAEEHHRIIPQSELLMLDASHFLPWRQTDALASALTDFVTRVDAGTALTRATAAPERIAAAERPFSSEDLPPFVGPTLLAAILLLMFATFVSEDLTCIATGLLVAQGRLTLLEGSLACFLGILIGDTLLYLAGRGFGDAALHRAPMRWFLKPGAVARGKRWFERRGAMVIFLSRFMPGLRLPTYFAAGMLRAGLLRFLLWFAAAGILWTPTIVYLSSLAGRSLDDALGLFHKWAAWAFVGLLLSVFLLERLVVPLFTWRGRRTLYGRWRRRTRWEYWPRWAVYLPVLGTILRAAWKYGSLRVVTAANPAIPTGGLAGESKSELLAKLLPGPEVARFTLLPAAPRHRHSETEKIATAAAERLVTLKSWMGAESLDWPLVLKPDCGDRGREVHIARDEQDARAYLLEHPSELLAQEYVSGEEFGVFWVHPPDEPHGRIFSIVRKDMPEVVGDGEHDLEHLVLAHPRHVAMAATLLEGLGERAFDVPAAGETVTISPIGTHSRGAIFLDGNEHITEELTSAIAAISARCEGFHFGRYDLRAPDTAALRDGRGLRILELNGLTSEAAHIYDPRHRFRDAVQVLREQWRLAYAIAAENRRRGARPASVGEILRGLFAR